MVLKDMTKFLKEQPYKERKHVEKVLRYQR